MTFSDSYVISNVLLVLQRPFCSTYFLRLTNLVYPSIIFFITAGLLKQLHPHMTRRERYATAAVVITFPILWFFNFMYYTDGGSTAFVLLSWLAAKRGHHFLSAAVSTEVFYVVRHLVASRHLPPVLTHSKNSYGNWIRDPLLQ